MNTLEKLLKSSTINSNQLFANELMIVYKSFTISISNLITMDTIIDISGQ